MFLFFFRTVPITFKEIDKYVEKVRLDYRFKGAVGRRLHVSLYLNHQQPEERRFTIYRHAFMNVPIVIYAIKDFFLLDAINDNNQ